MNTEDQAVDLLRDMVRQCSYSGQERGVLEVAAAAMRNSGFDRVWTDETGNLIGELRGTQPGGRTIFDAHVDVVLATSPENWARPPFSGDLSGGRVWGRGATDNKGSLAAMIAGLASLPRDQIHGTLWVVGSVGEEVLEGTGLAEVVQQLSPTGVVVGEPTGCRLGSSQRGRARLVFRVSGRAGHSSADDQSGNAVYEFGRLIECLRGQVLPEDEVLGRGSQAPIQLISQPYPSLSTVPEECCLTVDRRLVLGETAETILTGTRALLAGLPNAVVDLEEVTYTSYTGRTFTLPDLHPAWHTLPDSPLARACAAGLRDAGSDPVFYAVPYCTNASSSSGELGIPAIVYGPGDIAQAHAVDEYLDVDQLLQAARGYAGIARQVGA